MIITTPGLVKVIDRLTEDIEEELKKARDKSGKELIDNLRSLIELSAYKDFHGACNKCAGSPVKIRGKHPGDPDRDVCPTCAREILEHIYDNLLSGCDQASQEKR